jgi:hypothetical protein
VQIHWVATLPHVREVSLRGTLRGVPHLLIGASSKFMGLPFREVSISEMLHENEARLIQAYNSRRFFAFCERTFFSTPYLFAKIAIGATSMHADGVLHAEMHGDREPTSVTHEHWDMTIHLPRERKFYARLTGLTRRYPFLPADVADLPGFTGEEWIVRDDATHAKSKTYS